MGGKIESSCLFCNIGQGKIPAKVVYEDQQLIAFLDIKPANPGHILLITKQHYSHLTEIPDQLAGYVFVIAKAISQVLEKSMKIDGINILINQGEVAGQIAGHFILHIIPRTSDDGINLKWQPQEIEEQELNKIWEALKKIPIEVNNQEEKPPQKIETKKEGKIERVERVYSIKESQRTP